MKNYILQTNPFIVPTTDGKLIEEHLGLATTGDARFSVAHMVAPPGWAEPHQTPSFDEITIVISGRKRVEVDGEPLTLQAGQCIWVRAGARVRYSNPHPEVCEYWSVCLPAFRLADAHREAE